MLYTAKEYLEKNLIFQKEKSLKNQDIDLGLNIKNQDIDLGLNIKNQDIDLGLNIKEDLEKLKKLRERQKYDEVWALIKKENHWT